MCWRTGHIAAACFTTHDFEKRQDPSISKGKAATVLEPGWHSLDANAQAGPSSSRPPSFNSSSQSARASWAAMKPVPELIISRVPRPNTVPKDPNAIFTSLNEAPALAGENRPAPSSPSRPLQCAATVSRKENPSTELQCTPLITPPPPSPSANMVY
jgi:hypothetical protein